MLSVKRRSSVASAGNTALMQLIRAPSKTTESVSSQLIHPRATTPSRWLQNSDGKFSSPASSPTSLSSTNLAATKETRMSTNGFASGGGSSCTKALPGTCQQLWPMTYGPEWKWEESKEKELGDGRRNCKTLGLGAWWELNMRQLQFLMVTRLSSSSCRASMGIPWILSTLCLVTSMLSKSKRVKNLFVPTASQMTEVNRLSAQCSQSITGSTSQRKLGSGPTKQIAVSTGSALIQRWMR